MTKPEEQIIVPEIVRLLNELRIGAHRNGYRQLILLICCYLPEGNRSLTKELYPFVAGRFGYSGWHPVEHTVRTAILDAWDRRVPEVWEKYFPGSKRAPTNKQFIAVLAETLKNSPPVSGRG